MPAYVSPIAVAFNLEGVDSLNMSAETIANIFNGTITKWNDTAIAGRQRGVDLPDRDRDHPPLRRLGYDGQLHRLPLQGQQRRLDRRGRRRCGPIKAWRGRRGHLRRDRWSPNGDGAIGYADESAVGDLGSSPSAWVTVQRPDRRGRGHGRRGLPRVEGRPDVDMAIDIDRTITEAGAYPLCWRRT